MDPRRIYIDTSVFGGVFDLSFQDASKTLLDEIRTGRTIGVLSDVVLTELDGAPSHIRALIDTLPPKHLESVARGPESARLAEAYLRAGVVPAGSHMDAHHVALATVCRVDVIVSWNFKHIVNLRRIHGFNGVNLMQGYGTLEIRSPQAVLLEPK